MAQNTTFRIDSTLDLKISFQSMNSLRKKLGKYIDLSRFLVGRSNKKNGIATHRLTKNYKKLLSRGFVLILPQLQVETGHKATSKETEFTGNRHQTERTFQVEFHSYTFSFYQVLKSR